jgi:hypothetical protein
MDHLYLVCVTEKQNWDDFNILSTCATFSLASTSLRFTAENYFNDKGQSTISIENKDFDKHTMLADPKFTGYVLKCNSYSVIVYEKQTDVGYLFNDYRLSKVMKFVIKEISIPPTSQPFTSHSMSSPAVAIPVPPPYSIPSIPSIESIPTVPSVQLSDNIQDALIRENTIDNQCHGKHVSLIEELKQRLECKFKNARPAVEVPASNHIFDDFQENFIKALAEKKQQLMHITVDHDYCI